MTLFQEAAKMVRNYIPLSEDWVATHWPEIMALSSEDKWKLGTLLCSKNQLARINASNTRLLTSYGVTPKEGESPYNDFSKELVGFVRDLNDRDVFKEVSTRVKEEIDQLLEEA